MVAVQTHRRAELAADILSTFGLSLTPTPTPVRGTTINGLAYGRFVDGHGEGGQQTGSDAWRAFMRRQTCSVTEGASLSLAQGVRFDLDGAA
jgi:hypothetical protein